MIIEYDKDVSQYDETSFKLALDEYQNNISKGVAVGFIMSGSPILSNISHRIVGATLEYPTLHLLIDPISNSKGDMLKILHESKQLRFGIVGLGTVKNGMYHLEGISEISAII